MPTRPRPCLNLHPTPIPASCEKCWLFEYDPLYRTQWQGDGPCKVGPPPRPGQKAAGGTGLSFGPPVVVPDPPPLTRLQPKSRLAVVTFVSGKWAGELLMSSGPLMAEYAKRVGADFVVLTWPGHPDWPMSGKFQIPRVLDHYERIAYVDADVLLRPGCVNLFDMCEPDEFGACDELPFHRRQPQFGLEDNYLDYRRRLGFEDIEVPWYFNAGVMVVARQHQNILMPPDGPIPTGHCSEQHNTNARLLAAARAGMVKFRDMDRRANWQNWTDPGFKDAPADAVLHWSGAGGGRNDRAKDMARVARPFLPAPAPRPQAVGGGPGTELKALLAEAGFEAGNCTCNSRAAQMDAWGPAACRERRDEIVGWMKEAYRRLGWLARLGGAFKALRNGLVFDVSDPVGGLVDEAIRRAEAKMRIT